MKRFVRVATASEVPPGTGKLVMGPFEKPMALFNVDGTFHAMNYICPHMGGPLGEATVCKDATLECPWHGYRFSLETGGLVENPNERIMAELRRRAPACFRPENAPRYALAPLAYQVVGDQVYVQRRRNEP